MIWTVLAIWCLANALIFIALLKPLPKSEIREVRRRPF